MATGPIARAGLQKIAGDVTDYYAGTLAQHGATPRGVDWSCKPTQELRFIQLLRICSFEGAISLNDVGCGYGALLGFLRQRHRRASIDYLGVDLSQAMVDSARSRWGHLPQTIFDTAGGPLRLADYSIASGLFNVRLHHADTDWEPWVAHTLHGLHTASRIGFSVNFLLPAQPGEVSPQALYRPAIDQWKRFCEDDLQSTVEMVTGYGMREYTLLVRKRQGAFSAAR
jgi:SAM-dependent methyltransferase